MKALAALLVLTALALGFPAAAHQYKAGDIAIGHPWSRPAAKGMNGVGYLTLTNTGDTPDVLMAVESDVAAKVQIHESSMAGGVMRMTRLKHGVTIPAHGQVELAPAGKHVMMIKLRRPLAVGDKVPATLVFRKAGRVDVVFVVQAAAPGHMH